MKQVPVLVTFSFSKFWGSLSVELVKRYEFVVGQEERHSVLIEKQRNLLFAGFRPQQSPTARTAPGRTTPRTRTASAANASNAGAAPQESRLNIGPCDSLDYRTLVICTLFGSSG
ncbi:hypothetical protein ACGFH8_17495 [Micromonospora sp. NPDC049175]|uniref:hypothetical protein n=1 Tax=Micromonospora sp. NPDC049175 TaxID=3364266 RepID=UPI003720B452